MESTVDSYEKKHCVYIYVSLYLYVPDEGSLLPKYRDCTTSNDFQLIIYTKCEEPVIENKTNIMFFNYVILFHCHVHVSNKSFANVSRNA